jgi:hypothetical protein
VGLLERIRSGRFVLGTDRRSSRYRVSEREDTAVEHAIQAAVQAAASEGTRRTDGLPLRLPALEVAAAAYADGRSVA